MSSQLSVSLHVYDLSMGMAKTMSQQILGRQIDYVPHTGIVLGAGTAGAMEYFFGGGIDRSSAGLVWLYCRPARSGAWHRHSVP